MDVSADPSEAHIGSTIQRLLLVLYGIGIAAGSWWLIDDLATDRFLALNIAESAVVSLIGIALVTVIATVALLLSSTALIAAAGAMVLGIVLGGYGSRAPLVTLPSDDLQFTLLRGAYEPAIWILGAVWAVLAIARLRATSK